MFWFFRDKKKNSKAHKMDFPRTPVSYCLFVDVFVLLQLLLLLLEVFHKKKCTVVEFSRISIGFPMLLFVLLLVVIVAVV